MDTLLGSHLQRKIFKIVQEKEGSSLKDINAHFQPESVNSTVYTLWKNKWLYRTTNPEGKYIYFSQKSLMQEYKNGDYEAGDEIEIKNETVAEQAVQNQQENQKEIQEPQKSKIDGDLLDSKIKQLELLIDEKDKTRTLQEGEVKNLQASSKKLNAQIEKMQLYLNKRKELEQKTKDIAELDALLSEQNNEISTLQKLYNELMIEIEKE